MLDALERGRSAGSLGLGDSGTVSESPYGGGPTRYGGDPFGPAPPIQSQAVALDVDSASFARMRAALRQGRLPDPDGIRPEEWLNYFRYDRVPDGSDQPVAMAATLLPAPWNPDVGLFHITLSVDDVPAAARPPLKLVLVIDTSGSQGEPGELDLVKRIVPEMIPLLRPQDQLAIISYDWDADIELPWTRGSDADAIRAAVAGLSPGGPSEGVGALEMAYDMLRDPFDPAAVNRLLLIGDAEFSDWAGGLIETHDLLGLIRSQRDTGISLSVLGVGTGGGADALMQTLATAGNGVATFADSPAEARKVLVDDFVPNLYPVLSEARLLVEFNSAHVARHKLVGYTARRQSIEAFLDPNSNAGEVGSGQQVTIIFQVIAPGSLALNRYESRYERRKPPPPPVRPQEFAMLSLRYKRSGEYRDRQMVRPIGVDQRVSRLSDASADSRFAAAVAGFAGLLQGLDRRPFGFADVHALAEGALGRDPTGSRAAFVDLVRQAWRIACRDQRAGGRVRPTVADCTAVPQQ